ncbi:MAG: hypothetical protein HY063_14250 [Bacteroidetes bacterium]|nr:hypothetical protein [Bacteroidota bacterium]
MLHLEPDFVYHIFNRGNGNEKIFLKENNYTFFLKRYKEYIFPITDTFCYCLMPNHFHFLIRIKSENELKLLPDSNLQGFQNLEGFISQQFSNFFNAYSKAFNKQQNRKGSLFMHTFKRKKITNEKYLRKVVHYIHYNPVEAGLAGKPKEWKYSSYNALLSSASTLLLKEETINWFEDKENFIYCHNFPPKETGIEDF